MSLKVETAEFHSGWPGTRGYKWVLGEDGKEIDPDFVHYEVETLSGGGALSVSYKIIEFGPGHSKLEFSVAMPEGDAFNPSKHRIRLEVVFRYR